MSSINNIVYINDKYIVMNIIIVKISENIAI